MVRRRLLAALLGLVLPFALSSAPPFAARAADFPSRYVTLVVPLAAGSGTDAVARLVGARLAEVLGVQVVVENRVGANGVIGASFVARAAPDGYTLLIGGTTTHAANPSLMKNVTYDPVADFTPLGQIGVYPYALFVAGSSPYKSLPEVIAAAKARPGTLSFAHANALGQLSGELLKRNAALDVFAVPYRGSPQALTDVIGGRVTMMFVDTLPAVAQIEAGTLRPLAVTTRTRTALLPDVPTLGEIGVGGARVEAWSGLFVPARTPAPIVDRLADALRTTMDDPELRKRLAAVGFEVQPAPGKAFGERVAADVAQWRTLTQEIGLEPQ